MRYFDFPEITKVEIDKRSVDSVNSELKEIVKILKSSNMQLYRAKKYRDYTVKKVSGKSLGLDSLSEVTKKIAGDHPPEWNSGNVVGNMNVKKMDGNSAGAGYFGDDPGNITGKNITQTQAAIYQHTGYRIPLTGPKGARVRAWLARKGAFDTGAMDVVRSFQESHKKSSGEKLIIVKPRPFMFISLNAYISEDRDFKAANEYLDKELKKANV